MPVEKHNPWWKTLPASRKMELRRHIWKYLRRHVDIPTIEDLDAVLHWSRLENDILEAHSLFLAAGKRHVELQGRVWTVDSMVEFSRDHPEFDRVSEEPW